MGARVKRCFRRCLFSWKVRLATLIRQRMRWHCFGRLDWKISRVKLQGFIVTDRMDLWPPALAELGKGVATGQLKYRETISQGLASAPGAFIGLLKGENFGKQLVKLA